MTKAILEAQNLAFSYNGCPVLRDICLQVPQGGLLSIVGPNGSGKTTLLRLLCGAVRPKGGRVLYCGEDAAGLDVRRRAQQFALIRQQEEAESPFTCLDTVILGLHPNRTRFGQPTAAQMALVRRVMEETDTLRFAQKQVARLSGGERQRVTLARALAQNPRVLFLDEAMSELDISAKMQMLRLLRGRVEREGLTVVAVNHDVNTAYRFSDCVVALKKGQLAACGSPARVMDKAFFAEVFGVKAEIFPDKGFFIQDTTEE